MLSLQEPYNQFSEHDEKTLNGLANSVDGLMCEVGCWTGHSTSILASRAKSINRRLIVVDNFKGNEGTPIYDYAKDNNVSKIFEENMKSLGLWNNIILFNMDSEEAHPYIAEKSLILLFIDAGHTYNDIKKDLLNYIPKVMKGGIICGHDYESETYDEQHINEDYVDGKHHGVIKAVNEVFGSVKHDGRMWWTWAK